MCNVLGQSMISRLKYLARGLPLDNGASECWSVSGVEHLLVQGLDPQDCPHSAVASLHKE
jgi:hypothetical protein